MATPNYVYVASSWRNPLQAAICAMLRGFDVPHYDFKRDGFSWKEVALTDPCTRSEYLLGLEHPRAIEGYNRDMEALKRADATVLVWPCGRSAHLELGYAVGMGQRTAIVMLEEDTVEPDLMYKMVDTILTTSDEFFDWLEVPQ